MSSCRLFYHRRVAQVVQIAVVGSGGRGEVMAAAARGAKSAGGTTIGILPGESRVGANEWIDHVVVTGVGHARNLAVVASGDAVIAVGGAWGTLSEIGLARAKSRSSAICALTADSRSWSSKIRLMSRLRTTNGVLLVVLLAAIGFMLIYVPTKVVELYDRVKGLGSPFIYLYWGMVGTGGAINAAE